MHTETMKLMINLASKAGLKADCPPLTKITFAAIVQTPLGPCVDPGKLREGLKAGGFAANFRTAVENHKRRLLAKRAVALKPGEPVVVHDHELVGKSGVYCSVAKGAPEYSLDGALAHGRSSDEDDALLHAMFGAVREER